MKAAHRRVHVVLWALVLVAAVATIVAGTLLQSGPPAPGPTLSAGVESTGANP